MSKPLKALMKSELTKQFGDIDGGILITAQGLDSEKTYAFRVALHKRNVKYTVLRNSLARHAFMAKGYEAKELAKVLKGPVGLLYTEEEGSAANAARFLSDWKREARDKVVQWAGALVDGSVVPAEGAEALKELPTKPQALAMLLGVMQAPATQLLGTVREPYARVVYVLNKFHEKQEGKSA